MFGGSKKPYTAITVQIERLTSEQYDEEDLSGIIDLVEVIRIQASGPTEAARALRKKLKYGNPHRQIRALVILDGLIQNAGTRFQRAFADEALLERLRLLPREDTTDPRVKKKCRSLFTQWAVSYKDTDGLSGIAKLFHELPKSQRPGVAAARQKVLRDSEPASPTSPNSPEPPYPLVTASSSRATTASSNLTASASAPVSRPVTLTQTSSSFSSKLSKSKKSSSKTFNLAKEKENMTSSIARASIASTNLLNGLQLTNRESERISDNVELMNRFEICKSLRRQILFYIQHVESDDWIGSLVNANDELVKALTAFEIMDRSISDDSDSDTLGPSPPRSRQHSRTLSQDAQQQLAQLSLDATRPPKPPRPSPGTAQVPHPPRPPIPTHVGPSQGSLVDTREEDDEDNPFGDSNAVSDPHNELAGLTWKDV